MTDLKLNENEIRFKGRIPIKEGFLPETDYTFLVKAQRVEVVNHDNQDGTYDSRYVMGLLDVEVVDQ